MLQFIVLGRIPGTSFQLNFYNYLAILGVCLVAGWIAGLIIEQMLIKRCNKLATNLWPHLKFRRYQDRFRVTYQV